MLRVNVFMYSFAVLSINKPVKSNNVEENLDWFNNFCMQNPI